MDGPDAPGFFGKFASHGDFVTRRLPPSFVAVWDGWLGACLHASREQLGADWLPAYLTAPIWRFALAPGVCDGASWGGVMIPSVDRVGRHFPLTLAGGANGALPLGQWLGKGAWYDRIEALALSTLDAGFDFAGFDAALAAMDGLPAGADAGAHGPLGWSMPVTGVGEAAAAAPPVLAAAMWGQGVWWTDGSERVDPCVRLFRGLPPPQAFTAMLFG